MPRTFEATSLKVLNQVIASPGIEASDLFDKFSRVLGYKHFYNLIYRLRQGGYVENKINARRLSLRITPAGRELLSIKEPKRDGVWRIVIFDIKEKHRGVRDFLRGKLKQLNFKKWQNSIWVSPYALSKEVEDEFKELSQKYFVRLIKTTDINEISDLEKLFE